MSNSSSNFKHDALLVMAGGFISILAAFAGGWLNYYTSTQTEKVRIQEEHHQQLVQEKLKFNKELAEDFGQAQAAFRKYFFAHKINDTSKIKNTEKELERYVDNMNGRQPYYGASIAVYYGMTNVKYFNDNIYTPNRQLYGLAVSANYSNAKEEEEFIAKFDTASGYLQSFLYTVQKLAHE